MQPTSVSEGPEPSVLSLAGRRILFIAPQPFYEDRGSPIAVLQVLRALSDLGARIDVLAFPSGQPVDLANLRILRFGNAFGFRNIPIGFSFKKVILDIAMMRGLHRRLKMHDYDCIHALEDGIYVALAVRAARRLPIIYDMHSCIPEQLSTHPLLGSGVAQSLLKKMERYALRRSQAISCSVGLKKYIQSIVPDKEVTEWSFSYPQVEGNKAVLDARAAAIRSELGIGKDTPVAMYAGNFKDYQGVDLLIDATPTLRKTNPDAVLVLLGASEGDDVDQIRKRGEGAIIVCPRQPHARVAEFLHMSQVLVSPRKWGGNLPLKLFEYLAAGKPIVATDNEHHRFLLDEERAVFSDNTPAGLAAAIGQLLDDPEKMQRLALAARQYSETKLGWARLVDSVSQLYRSALPQGAE